MIERPLPVQAEHLRSGRLGVGNCAYACPGCPRSVRADALHLRIIGYGPESLRLLRSAPRAMVELASGELPGEPAELAELRDLRVARLLIPIFGLEERHDARAGSAGSFRRAQATAAAARAAGLAVSLLVPAPGVPPKELPSAQVRELRALLRLSWDMRTPVTWSADGVAPCIGEDVEYN